MQITVFGASGRVGRKVIEAALRRGHTVRVLVHNNNPFEPSGQLSIVKGDAKDRAAVEEALLGCHAVISTLGSWGTSSKDIVSAGTENIIYAMEKQGIKRIITLTGSGARWLSDKPSFSGQAGRFFLKLAAPKVLADGERHLELLEASSLEWTCVRSPAMKNGNSSAYELRLRQPPLWTRINRQAVAECLLDLAVTREYARQAPVIQPGVDNITG